MQKGVLLKKVLASGHIDKLATTNPIQNTFDFVYKHPGVTSVVVGTINPTHLKENIQCAYNAIIKANLSTNLL